MDFIHNPRIYACGMADADHMKEFEIQEGRFPSFFYGQLLSQNVPPQEQYRWKKYPSRDPVHRHKDYQCLQRLVLAPKQLRQGTSGKGQGCKNFVDSVNSFSQNQKLAV